MGTTVTLFLLPCSFDLPRRAAGAVKIKHLYDVNTKIRPLNRFQIRTNKRFDFPPLCIAHIALTHLKQIK